MNSEWIARQKFYDRLMSKLFLGSAGMITMIILAIIFFVGQQGIQTFAEVSPSEFFFSSRWEPTEGQYGAFSFIFGTLAVTFLSVVVGAPLAIFCAIFISKVVPSRFQSTMKSIVSLYAAIPSVVYGFLGITILIPWVRETFGVESGYGLFTASLILSVMILPTIVNVSEDALQAVPKRLEEGSIALGATRWQTLWRVVLPAASPGIMTGVILGMARAVGETMAVQMVIGNAAQIPKSLFTSASTLPSEIVLEMGNTPFGTAWGNSLFLMALVLLLLSLMMIITIRRMVRREAV